MICFVILWNKIKIKKQSLIFYLKKKQQQELMATVILNEEALSCTYKRYPANC